MSKSVSEKKVRRQPRRMSAYDEWRRAHFSDEKVLASLRKKLGLAKGEKIPVGAMSQEAAAVWKPMKASTRAKYQRAADLKNMAKGVAKRGDCITCGYQVFVQKMMKELAKPGDDRAARAAHMKKIGAAWTKMGQSDRDRFNKKASAARRKNKEEAAKAAAKIGLAKKA